VAAATRLLSEMEVGVLRAVELWELAPAWVVVWTSVVQRVRVGRVARSALEAVGRLEGERSPRLLIWTEQAAL
jgi:hypothetical protein